jgi:hypothetical protein
MAFSNSASRSSEGSAAGSTDASRLAEADAEGVTDDCDDTAPASACALTYTVPAAVPPTTTADASTVERTARLREDRARRRVTLWDSMPAMLESGPVRGLGRA